MDLVSLTVHEGGLGKYLCVCVCVYTYMCVYFSVVAQKPDTLLLGIKRV